VSEDQKKEAEQKFIEVAWAYEVLSDPNQKPLYDTPGAGPTGGGPGGPSGPDDAQRGFNMKAATKIFEDVFGSKSTEFRDLVDHLARATSGGADAEELRKHAQAIKKAMKKNGGDSFNVETKSKDGNERLKTKQTAKTKNGQTTKTTVTEHTKSSVNGKPSSLDGGPAGHLHAHAAHAHAAHMAAHEAAVKASQQAALGHGAHGRISEL